MRINKQRRKFEDELSRRPRAAHGNANEDNLVNVANAEMLPIGNWKHWFKLYARTQKKEGSVLEPSFFCLAFVNILGNHIVFQSEKWYSLTVKKGTAK